MDLHHLKYVYMVYITYMKHYPVLRMCLVINTHKNKTTNQALLSPLTSTGLEIRTENLEMYLDAAFTVTYNLVH